MDSQPLYSAAQIREVDRRAIQDRGIAGYELMTRAASAALASLRAHWPRARRLLVLCGAGNNAGDGYVMARLAQAAGLDARIGYLRDPSDLTGDARTAWQAARAAGIEIRPFSATALAAAEVVVDALLGTGLERPLEGEWADAVAAVNAAPVPVLALDIPSGLQADTGAILGAAVRAEVTLTFIAGKPGLFTGSGPDRVGRVELASLDLAPDLFADLAPPLRRIDAAWLRAHLPARRPRGAHKGHFGHVLVVGGQPGMPGAARLAAEAAARTGAGLVSVATHPSHAAVLAAGRPELMCHGIQNAGDLLPLLARATVVLVGPGLGQGAWARGLLPVLWESGLPKLVDADALNLLAGDPLQRDDWVLTPHPGEAARLLGSTAAAVQADRLQAAGALQRRYGGVAVLKGAGTLIADGADLWLSSAGNPGMASGGMGDVLAGVIAGLMAQGLGLRDAAAVGVLLHGLAGDAAAVAGERGLLASDLFAELRRLLNPP